jgi:hypothetical protein
MAAKPISRREARALRKRVAELESILEQQRYRWAEEYPGGTHIDDVTVDASVWATAHTARLLQHAVVVIPRSNNVLRLFGLPLAKP